jgi:hypothetical protein
MAQILYSGLIGALSALLISAGFGIAKLIKLAIKKIDKDEDDKEE